MTRGFASSVRSEGGEWRIKKTSHKKACTAVMTNVTTSVHSLSVSIGFAFAMNLTASLTHPGNN